MEEIRTGSSIRIYGVIHKDIMRTEKISGTSKLIYCYLISFSGGSDKVFPGLDLMSKELGMSKPTIIKHRKELEKIGLLTVERERTSKGVKNVYYLQDVDFRGENKTPNANTNTINYDKEKKDKIPYKEIIDYLNEKAGKNFSHTAKGNKKLIGGRFNEGNSVEVFKHVIDVKVADWLEDEGMKTYLKPETLFNSTNFDKYKNETIEEVQARKQHWGKNKTTDRERVDYERDISKRMEERLGGM